MGCLPLDLDLQPCWQAGYCTVVQRPLQSSAQASSSAASQATALATSPHRTICRPCIATIHRLRR